MPAIDVLGPPGWLAAPALRVLFEAPEEPLAFALGAVLLAGVVLYALLGGADFGGGIWDLCAAGPRREEQRAVIARAIGPVWEANHVWLIFVIVTVFTAFPPVFAALSVALFVPLSLALIGIVFRGAAFVFRSYGKGEVGAWQWWGWVFAIASTVTPALLGMCAGAVATGEIRVEGGRVVAGESAWLGAFPLVIGALALAICAYLAAVYLTLETVGALREDFRRRALWAGAICVGLALAALPLARSQAPRIWHGLTSWEAGVVVPLALALAAISGWAVWRRRFHLARLAAATEVATLLGGWAAAQYPYLVYPDLTVAGAAAPEATLRATLIVLGLGTLILLPSLWLLFVVFKAGPPGDTAARLPSADGAG